MAKNLIICCDGTNNQFGPNNTNVVRVVQVADRTPTLQRVYYDPGVGTLPEPGFVTRVGRWLSDLRGLAFGAGLDWKLQEAYAYLMELWDPGDHVYLFGFSRGAYTVRVLAGLLHELGLLARGNDNLIPYALRLFKTARKDHPGIQDVKSPYWQLRDDFRRAFARQVTVGDQVRRFPIHFIGIWDTVSSIGWVWDPPKFPFITHNPSVQTIRHAVSIDERRWFFRQNLMEKTGNQDLDQRWFPGVHCDVGGGYPQADGGLWRRPFEWILGEAKNAGFRVDAERLQEILGQPLPPKPWDDTQHESLTALWWPAEFFPKLCWNPKTRHRVPAMGFGRHRFIADGQVLDKSTLLRIREANYAPANLDATFLQKILGLADVPEKITYSR